MSSLKKILHFLLAVLAYWWYGRPARKLIVIGVTGTKGKSTTSRLVASVLEAGGDKVGLLTTVEFQIGDKHWINDKKMTMLGRGQIQWMLRQMVRAGCKYAVIETSSEGILQYRHYGLNYDVVVFTNLGTEHQERHGGFENLKKEKGKIFAQLMDTKHKIIGGQKIPKIIVANLDDKNADYYLQFPADKKYGFSKNNLNIKTEALAILTAKDIVSDNSGERFTVGDTNFALHILGEFNVYNALAAVAVGESQGIGREKIAAGLASVKLVEGRMEMVDGGQDFKVIVDYAHEPMSLTELFTSLRHLIGGNPSTSPEPRAERSGLGQYGARKVIGVVGSDGGGRDKGKREAMGEVAGRLCDFVVITDVNCYDEDPAQIAEMLAMGARKAGKKDNIDLFVIIDRREAIAKAISLAGSGDAVAITAKGTEPYMAMAGGKRIPWDDRQVAREVLK